MAMMAMIMVVVLVAILIISFIFEQEQESEAHYDQTQGFDINDNKMDHSNYPLTIQFKLPEKNNRFIQKKGGQLYEGFTFTDYRNNFLPDDYIFENWNGNYKGQNYKSHPHPNYNYNKMDKIIFSLNNNNHASKRGYTDTSCCSCGRYCYQDTKVGEFINLGDGRILCQNCYSISIMDAKKCKFLFRLVHQFFKSFHLELDKDPILLMDQYEIMKLRGSNERCEGAFVIKEFGVGKTIMRIESCSLEGEKIKKINVPQKKTNQEAWVLLTFGYPKFRTGVTLAHEMMHSWFYRQGLTGPKRLEKNVEEGICELMGFKWMNWCMDNKYISDDPFVKRLTSHYKFAVARMDGFKEAWDVVQKHGLKNTLEHLVNTRSFPKC